MTNPDIPPPPPITAPPLAPPPGYVGYTATNWAAGLRRVSGLAKALVILLAVYAVGQVITTATTPATVDAAVEFLRTGDEDAFNEDLGASTIGGWIASAAQLAVIVLSIIWLYRVAANHRGIGRQITWAPGWAIAGWILPPLLFVIPLLMLRESWKASSPDVPPGSPEWKQRGESPLIWLWFVLYSLVPIVLIILGASQFRSFTTDRRDLAEYFEDQESIIIASGVVSVLGAIAWALVVREITRRHLALTGEAAQR